MRGNAACFLTLRHPAGPLETGWLTLGEAPSCTPEPLSVRAGASLPKKRRSARARVLDLSRPGERG
jgi:hypothetical protein